MATPFPHNATLTFQVRTASGFVDASGNPLPLMTALKLKASLTIDKSRQSRMIVQPGDDPNLTYFVGRCITPLFLPLSVKANSKAQCVLKELSSGLESSGEFTITNIIQSRWAVVAKVLGSRFEGYFIRA